MHGVSFSRSEQGGTGRGLKVIRVFLEWSGGSKEFVLVAVPIKPRKIAAALGNFLLRCAGDWRDSGLDGFFDFGYWIACR